MTGIPDTARAQRPALGGRAMEHLSFIRSTIERATPFTAVPGWRAVAMGVTALIAAPLAAAQGSRRAWLIVWLVDAAVATSIGSFALSRKARSLGGAILAQPTSRLLLSFTPPTTAD